MAVKKKPNVKDKHIQLSMYEAEVLARLAQTTGRKEVEVIRDLILHYKPVEAPGEKFYEAIDEIRKIGTNINQIAHVANATGYVDVALFEDERQKLDRLIVDLRRIVLEPHKIRDIVDIVNSLEFALWDTEEKQQECWRLQTELKKLIGVSKEGYIGNGDY